MTNLNLFIISSPPYQTHNTNEGFDALMAFAAFDQPSEALLIGDGVYNLLCNQNRSHTKNIEKIIKSFEMYDIPPLYVCIESMQKRNITQAELVVSVKLLDMGQISRLINSAKHCFEF